MARGSNKYRTRGLSAKIEVKLTPEQKARAPALARAEGYADVSAWVRWRIGLDPPLPTDVGAQPTIPSKNPQ